MQDFALAFADAMRLVIGLDPDLMEIISLSLEVSLAAVLLAALIGLPVGAALAVVRFPGRIAVIVLMNA